MKINYYDNKAKNIFAMLSIFCFLLSGGFAYIISNIIDIFWDGFNIHNISDILSILYDFSSIFLSFVPCILLLVFAILIFKNYGFKKWILPIFFIATLALIGFDTIIMLVNIVIYKDYLSIRWILEDAYSLLSNMTAFTGLALLFIGSLNNFKLTGLFKAGTIIMVVAYVFDILFWLYILIPYLLGFIHSSFILGAIEYFPLLYSIMRFSFVANAFFGIIFMISLFVLTTRKKTKKIEAPKEVTLN